MLKQTYFDLEGLAESEYRVVKCLHVWNHMAVCSNYFNIARSIGMSDSAVCKALRTLEYRGVVRKTVGGVWILNQNLKNKWDMDSKEIIDNSPKKTELI
jgi:predicted transcriptional regulator